MKFVILNGNIIESSAVKLDGQNRAFQFGDGFFETILFSNGEAKFFDKHFSRINKGISILGFEPNPTLSEASIEREVQLLCHVNVLNHCRIKIIFWRNWGGLYSPEIQSFNYLIFATPAKEPNSESITKIGISKNYRNAYSPTSGIKTLSSLKYVLAGKEMAENQWQDVILLDQNNQVSEALHSNIFCVKNGVFYTPSAQSGCIIGVMRTIILESLSNKNQVVEQALFDIDFLFNSDSLYVCNVSGIRRIDSWNGVHLYQENSFFENLRQLIAKGEKLY